MGRTELIFKVLGVVTTVTFGVASIVIELKRKTKLTDEDIEEIADRTAKKVKALKVVTAGKVIQD